MPTSVSPMEGYDETGYFLQTGLSKARMTKINLPGVLDAPCRQTLSVKINDIRLGAPRVVDFMYLSLQTCELDMVINHAS